MKNYLYKGTLGLMLVLAVMACEKKNNKVIPSDNITSEFRDITGYTEVEVNAAFEMEINFTGTPQPVEIIANENLHPYIEVTKSSDKLVVGLQNNISISGQAELKIVLTTDFLTGYTANGASLIKLMDTSKTSQVAINLTGASNMSGPVITESLSADIREASILDVSVTTTDLSLNASSASRMGGYSFTCQNLDADLAGASVLRYKGDANIESQDLQDASTIVKTD